MTPEAFSLSAVEDRVAFTGAGHAVPARRVPSGEIERRLDLDEGWIARRTGIESRRYVENGAATSDLALAAAERALDQAGRSASEAGLLLLATSTPDHLLPPTAPLLAERLGAEGIGAVDVTGACAGFLYALSLGHAFAHLHGAPVVVIGANVLSFRINPDDAATAALFSDAAGAVVLEPSPEAGSGGRPGGDGAVVAKPESPDRRARSLEALYLGSRGSKYDQIRIPAGGSRRPMTEARVQDGEHLMEMERGKQVFREAVAGMVRTGQTVLEKAGRTPEEIDWWIPHQANRRITDQAGEELGIPEGKTVSVIEEYGNSSAATIPLGLSLALQEGRIARGDRLLLTAIGAGMIEAGVLAVW